MTEWECIFSHDRANTVPTGHIPGAPQLLESFGDHGNIQRKVPVVKGSIQAVECAPYMILVQYTWQPERT